MPAGSPVAGADRGGGILYLRPGVARAPPRPLNGVTLYELACVVSGFMEVVFDLVNPEPPSSDAGGTAEAG